MGGVTLRSRLTEEKPRKRENGGRPRSSGSITARWFSGYGFDARTQDLKDLARTTGRASFVGASLMEKIRQNAVPRYDPDFSFVQAGTPATLLEPQRAYSIEESSVFVARSPNRVSREPDLRYPEDPVALTSATEPDKDRPGRP